MLRLLRGLQCHHRNSPHVCSILCSLLARTYNLLGRCPGRSLRRDRLCRCRMFQRCRGHLRSGSCIRVRDGCSLKRIRPRKSYCCHRMLRRRRACRFRIFVAAHWGLTDHSDPMSFLCKVRQNWGIHSRFQSCTQQNSRRLIRDYCHRIAPLDSDDRCRRLLFDLDCGW